MRSLSTITLLAVLLALLVACDDTAEDNGSVSTPNAPQHDHDRIDHFEGQQSENLAEAIANLQEYNQKLQAVLEQDEIGRDNIVDVHEWTYTLENAIGRLQADLTIIADHLEEVHLASERGDADHIREHARKYLEGLAPLLAK